MASSSSANPVVPSNTDIYNQVRNHAFSLEMEDLQRLRDDVQGEINIHASEIVDRQREEEEERRREDEETKSLCDAWLPKHLERSDRKAEERKERYQRGPQLGSATEDNSDASFDAGYEYHLEEINTSDEDSDAAEDRRRMEKYEEWKLRRRFEFERENPKIFSRTMQEGEPKVERQTLVRIEPRTASDDESIASDEEDDEEETSYGDSDTSPASSGSSCSERYEEDEDWSYEDEDY